jgi:hypothetical protein
MVCVIIPHAITFVQRKSVSTPALAGGAWEIKFWVNNVCSE